MSASIPFPVIFPVIYIFPPSTTSVLFPARLSPDICIFPHDVGVKYRPSPESIEVPTTQFCHPEAPERLDMVPEVAAPVTPRTAVATFC